MTADRLPIAEEPASDKGTGRWCIEFVVVGALLLTHGILLTHCALSKSICHDEGAHLAAGMAYLRYGEFSIYNLSPPLMRMLGALPAYLWCDPFVPIARPMISLPAGSRAWAYYDLFQNANLTQLHSIVVAARMTVLPLSILCAAGVWLMARRWYGAVGGAVSLAIWAVSPSTVAFGSTFGTDMPLTAAALAAVAAWIAFLRRPTPGRALIAAVAVAAAHAVKFNAVLIFPALLAIAVIMPLKEATRRARWTAAVQGLALSMVLSYVTLCGSFGFRLMFEPLGRFEFASTTLRKLTAALPAGLPVPFPRYLVEGFDIQKWESESVYYNALFGEGYFGADWRYFPMHVLCKSTLGELLLIGLLLVTLAVRGVGRREWMMLAAAACTAGGMLLFTNINIGGTRYLLPAYPMIIVLMGGIAAVGTHGKWAVVRWGAMAAVSLSIAESLATAPQYHSFYNAFTKHMRFDVPESDWGQSLIDLRRWLQTQPGLQPADVAVLSSAPTWVEAYGLVPADVQNMTAAPYTAVSMRFLNGLPRRHRGVYVVLRNWRQLQGQSPVADVGGMVIFRSDHLQPPAGPPLLVVGSWLEAMSDPMVPSMRAFDERTQQGR